MWGAPLASEGIVDCEHVSAQQCQQGANSPQAGNQFHRERGGLGKRRIGDTLKYCILSYWIWCPDFPFSFFLPSVSGSWEIQSSGAAKSQTRNLWPKKRDCYGFYFRIDRIESEKNFIILELLYLQK